MVPLNHSTCSDIDFEHIFEMSPDLIYVIDREHNIIRANNSFTKRLNISSDSLVGSKYFWCIYQKNEPPDFCPHLLLLKDGQEHKAELFIKALDGWFSVTATPLWNDEDEITGSIFIARDITEQKRLENELRDSEEKYSKAFQTSFYAIAITSVEDGTYYEINHTFSALTGFTREEVINNSSVELNLWVDAEDRNTIISALMEGNEVKGKEVQIRRKDGELRSTLFSAQIIPFSNKPFLLSSILDVSEHKRAEEEIRQKSVELARLNAEKDKFFSVLAHDLRSPFHNLLGFSQMMVEDSPSLSQAEIQKTTRLMRDSITNVYGMLENLLEWSRMQRGMISFDPAPMLLLPSISLEMKSAMESADKKDITIHNTVPEDLMVFADQYLLGSILRNLISNAVKFTPKGEQIFIAAKPIPDGWIEISIKDKGIGMNQEMADNLFRLEVSTNRNGTDGEPSTGLGLILCKEFVNKSGGRLWVESDEGQGSTFYFTLPGSRNEKAKQ